MEKGFEMKKIIFSMFLFVAVVIVVLFVHESNKLNGAYVFYSGGMHRASLDIYQSKYNLCYEVCEEGVYRILEVDGNQEYIFLYGKNAVKFGEITGAPTDVDNSVGTKAFRLNIDRNPFGVRLTIEDSSTNKYYYFHKKLNLFK
jgi:hypothetical protein